MHERSSTLHYQPFMKIAIIFCAIVVALTACKKKNTCPVCTTSVDGIDIYAKIPVHSQTDTTICNDSLKAVFIRENTGTTYPTATYTETKLTTCK